MNKKALSKAMEYADKHFRGYMHSLSFSVYEPNKEGRDMFFSFSAAVHVGDKCYVECSEESYEDAVDKLYSRLETELTV